MVHVTNLTPRSDKLKHQLITASMVHVTNPYQRRQHPRQAQARGGEGHAPRRSGTTSCIYFVKANFEKPFFSTSWAQG
jgi:hypothetical protein